MTVPAPAHAHEDIMAVAERLETAHPREVVSWAVSRFPQGRVVVVTGLQADGVAVADMAIAADPGVRVLTIDTGRLPAETYEYLDTLRRHFGRNIEVVFPERSGIENFTTINGVNPFYGSPQMRQECCRLRKVVPLSAALTDVDCWLTGLRRSQSTTRQATPIIERDRGHGDIIKVNPLASWTDADTRAYLAERGVPLHPLYDAGYRSIGCAPCTRALRAGEDERAGRWWWEQGIDKECGIHVIQGEGS